MDLRQAVRIWRARWILTSVLLILAIVGAAGAAAKIPRSYQSTSTVLLLASRAASASRRACCHADTGRPFAMVLTSHRESSDPERRPSCRTSSGMAYRSRFAFACCHLPARDHHDHSRHCGSRCRANLRDHSTAANSVRGRIRGCGTSSRLSASCRRNCMMA